MMEKQEVNDNFAIYNGDCVETLKKLPDAFVGFSVFSPPFWSMYTYSDDPKDMANCETYEKFFDHFGFLVSELQRVTMPGRVVAVHCMDMPTYKRSGEEIGLRDFPGNIIQNFQKHGFTYHARFCIWKDPLLAAVRTKAIGLAHKQIVKDSSMCRTGIPDYMLAFRKPGENPKPIEHPNGLTEYHGSREVPSKFDSFLTAEDQGKNKRSHWIWQQYASPVWFDIRQTKVLPFREGKDEEDEKHICPLQLDVIERCLVLWSSPGDVVLSPFAGVGSEIVTAVKNGRKGLGIELKPRYFRQMQRNLRAAMTKKKQGIA